MPAEQKFEGKLFFSFFLRKKQNNVTKLEKIFEATVSVNFNGILSVNFIHR
jgi:hypothetical protein